MLEVNALAKKKAYEGKLTPGIHIQGWDYTGATRSAGMVEIGTTFYFNNADAVNWIRIPYAGSIDMAASVPNTRITIEFKIQTVRNNLGLRLWNRYKQSSDAASYALVVNPNLSIDLARNNQRVTTTGVVTVGQFQRITVERVSEVHYIYLNDVLIGQNSFAGNRVAAWDWTFGPLLTAGNQVNLSTANWDWELYAFEAKNI